MNEYTYVCMMCIYVCMMCMYICVYDVYVCMCVCLQHKSMAQESGQSVIQCIVRTTVPSNNSDTELSCDQIDHTGLHCDSRERNEGREGGVRTAYALVCTFAISLELRL